MNGFSRSAQPHQLRLPSGRSRPTRHRIPRPFPVIVFLHTLHGPLASTHNLAHHRQCKERNHPSLSLPPSLHLSLAFLSIYHRLHYHTHLVLQCHRCTSLCILHIIASLLFSSVGYCIRTVSIASLHPMDSVPSISYIRTSF